MFEFIIGMSFISAFGITTSILMGIDCLLRYNGIDIFGRFADAIGMSYKRRVRVQRVKTKYSVVIRGNDN